MSTFDELINTHAPPSTGDDFITLMRGILAADDLAKGEREGFAAGFLMGMTYALAKHNEGNVADAAHTLLRLQGEFEANGVFG